MSWRALPVPISGTGPSRCWLLGGCCALWLAASAAGADEPIVLPPPPGPATGLADAAAMRATVFGPRPQDLALMPEIVPLLELDLKLPWARPVPAVYWFDSRLRAWFSAQPGPAPLAIVIAGTGGDGNTSKLATLRAVLYGAGYHVLTVPSPTFPGFIVSASSTGVAGDLKQDSQDLYAAIQALVAHLPRGTRITDTDVLGYSLGGAHAAVIKSLDDVEHKLNIHRAIMINPPVSLFSSIGRLDELFTQSIGSGDSGVEQLYKRLYTRLANLYRRSNKVTIDETDLYSAASAVLRSDADFSAVIALSFRLSLVDVFYAGDLYAGTGVVVDPKHLPAVGDSLEHIGVVLRGKTFADYFDTVFAPYYLAHRPGSTPSSLLADNRLDIIADQLEHNPDYYAMTNNDDPILVAEDLAWLRTTLGARIVVYDHGGHLGNLGEHQQMADLLQMLSGLWQNGT
jgi:predicted alpha/beta-fold hydrolase